MAAQSKHQPLGTNNNIVNVQAQTPELTIPRSTSSNEFSVGAKTPSSATSDNVAGFSGTSLCQAHIPGHTFHCSIGKGMTSSARNDNIETLRNLKKQQ
jgi:hypothetical protein